MSVIIFLVVLILLILVHEFGHFITAKRSGIRVDEFGLGFSPKLFGKKWGETEYTLNLLPIGGFVRIFGEDPDADSMEGPDAARSFVRQPKWKQALVLVAGIGFNILFAWLLFTAGFLFGMPTAIDENATTTNARDVHLLVTATLPDSPAAEAGLVAGDVVERVVVGEESAATLSPSAVASFIAAHDGEAVTIEVLRHGSAKTLTVTPRQGVITDDPTRAATGFSMALAGVVSYPLHSALYQGVLTTWNILSDITVGLAQFFYRAVTFHGDFSQVTGPVGIVSMVGDASALGFAYLVTFTAFISLNLAVINLLPFPALDGGRLLFVIIESIKGSPIKPVVANTLNRIGFALLILLMVVVTYHDIIKLWR